MRPRPQCLMNHATYKYYFHIAYHKIDISQTELTQQDILVSNIMCMQLLNCMVQLTVVFRTIDMFIFHLVYHKKY